MKSISFRISILALGFTTCLWGPVFSLNSQEEQRAAILTKEIRQTKSSAKLYPLFEELKGIYFKNNQFDDFVLLLRSFGSRDKNQQLFSDYYTALSRYQQLRYLEENQRWQEYFAGDNTYRKEIAESLNRAIKSAGANEPLYIYSRLLLWRFYRDQQDPASEALLTDLMDGATEYGRGAAADAAVIKNTAEQLSSCNEKAESLQLYKLYVEKLVGVSKNSEELQVAAAAFYKEGNLELAEAIYNAYIERIVEAEGKGAIAFLINIAKQFSYHDRAPCDPAYAEKAFAKGEELGGKEAFDEESIYLRAFNLEKAKEYLSAKDRYLDLINIFPQTIHSDEAEYKIGIITTYVLSDLNMGRNYFTELSQKENITPQVISGIYQLGLLAQWEGNLEEARRYYLTLKEKAKEGFPETIGLANERLRELEESRPIEYKLKTFLDISLRPQNNAYFDRTRIDLRSHPYRSAKDEDTDINTSLYYGENGCMQPEIEYLWSGHLGTYRPSSKESQSAEAWALTKPDTNQYSFSTKYIHQGTKEINLVVVSSGGIIDRNLDMVDVY